MSNLKAKSFKLTNDNVQDWLDNLNGMSENVEKEQIENILKYNIRNGELKCEVIWSTDLSVDGCYAVQIVNSDFWLNAFDSKDKAEYYKRVLDGDIIEKK